MNDSVSNDVINEKVGAWLLQDGNTQQLLAQKIGISRPALANRLKGRTEWNWSEVVKVSRLTNCSLNELSGMTVA